jgi:hypothetical protein
MRGENMELIARKQDKPYFQLSLSTKQKDRLRVRKKKSYKMVLKYPVHFFVSVQTEREN